MLLTDGAERSNALALDDISARPLELIVANLHWRYTGVTATSRSVAPLVAREISAAWLGSDAPDGIVRLGLGGLLKLWGRHVPVLWHARRNNEMIVGVALRALGWPLKLIFSSAGQRRHTWITRWLIARMDAVIATSEISASFLERPATVVHHGVDAQRYAPPSDRIAAFAEAGLPGHYLIGCFGRVRAQKGTDLFVDAMCALLPRYPDFSAAIVGAITPDQIGFADGLRARIAAAGLQDRIVIYGEQPIDDVVRWFQRLTIYAFTSRNEGYGLTLIEAMASGAALVATRAGAAGIVIGDSDAGVLVPVGDAAKLAEAIEPLLRNPAAAAAMGIRGRARVMEKFSLQAEGSAIVSVYRAVLSAPRQSATNASRSPPANR
jgi:mannosyltransferase